MVIKEILNHLAKGIEAFTRAVCCLFISHNILCNFVTLGIKSSRDVEIRKQNYKR